MQKKIKIKPGHFEKNSQENAMPNTKVSMLNLPLSYEENSLKPKHLETIK